MHSLLKVVCLVEEGLFMLCTVGCAEGGRAVHTKQHSPHRYSTARFIETNTFDKSLEVGCVI